MSDGVEFKKPEFITPRKPKPVDAKSTQADTPVKTLEENESPVLESSGKGNGSYNVALLAPTVTTVYNLVIYRWIGIGIGSTNTNIFHIS
jgi:hypothetical protein